MNVPRALALLFVLVLGTAACTGPGITPPAAEECPTMGGGSGTCV